MRLRFRIGPFTFGKGGTRLSIWGGGSGVSVPLSKKKGKAFGKIGVGPVSAYFGGSKSNKESERLRDTEPRIPSSQTLAPIEAFAADQDFHRKLRGYGVPWRGVQERLKQELPESLSNRDEEAYKLVPIAMNTVFGEQERAWRTIKRPSKSGKGKTTWVLVISEDA